CVPQSYSDFSVSQQRSGFAAEIKDPAIWFSSLKDAAKLPGTNTVQLLGMGEYDCRRMQLKKLAAEGLHIIFGATEPDLRSSLMKYHYVNVWAHSRGEGAGIEIELADGFVSRDKFVQCVPATFSGILDLTACRGAYFQHAIKARAPRSFTMAVDRTEELSGWL